MKSLNIVDSLSNLKICLILSNFNPRLKDIQYPIERFSMSTLCKKLIRFLIVIWLEYSVLFPAWNWCTSGHISYYIHNIKSTSDGPTRCNSDGLFWTFLCSKVVRSNISAKRWSHCAVIFNEILSWFLKIKTQLL